MVEGNINDCCVPGRAIYINFTFPCQDKDLALGKIVGKALRPI